MDSEKLLEKINKIKIIVIDVDGTLTDGTVYYSKNGEELKRFSIRDGMAIELLRKSGIDTAILTSENSPIVTARANKLKINTVILGSRNKKADLINLCNQMNLSLENIAYIGDDINDLQAMQICGLSCCPSDSSSAILNNSDFISRFNGGQGAVREIAELILINQNKPILLPENW